MNSLSKYLEFIYATFKGIFHFFSAAAQRDDDDVIFGNCRLKKYQAFLSHSCSSFVLLYLFVSSFVVFSLCLFPPLAITTVNSFILQKGRDLLIQLLSIYSYHNTWYLQVMAPIFHFSFFFFSLSLFISSYGQSPYLVTDFGEGPYLLMDKVHV